VVLALLAVTLAVLFTVYFDGRNQSYVEPKCDAIVITRRSVPEVIASMREVTKNWIVAQERSIETILSAYVEHMKAPSGPLVYRFAGPTGTGKTTVACLLAHILCTSNLSTDASVCLKGNVVSESTAFVTHTFSKGENGIKDLLGVIKEVNKRLDGLPDGMVIVLNDYNLAEKTVWSMMTAFISEPNFASTVVIFTDDLTSDLSDDFKGKLNVHLTPDMPEREALLIINDEIRRVFPKQYQEISTKDVWIPFLPFHSRAVEVFVERACGRVDTNVKNEIPDYLGRLLCDMKSVTQASLKLEVCVADHGARVFDVFQSAFQKVLEERKFCPSGSNNLHDCVLSEGVPLKSLAFEVQGQIPQSKDCSQESMKRWITFRLLGDSF